MRVFRLALAGLALLGLAGAAPAPGTVLARLGPDHGQRYRAGPRPGRAC